jgi:UMF1 family MFS transporter
LFVALLSPLLSGIADYNGSKKRFMQVFCFIGSVSCSALFFFNRSNIEFGILAFMLGTIGWAGSLVFYNSYLPEIATEEEQDKVSAKGFALGYVGSSLLLIMNLIVILFPESFGIPKESSLPARIAFLAVGIWWFGFAQYTFYYLPKNKSSIKFKFDILWKGYRELAGVWAQLKKLKDLKAFLYAFFFFTMGIQTVMYIATILIIQFVAIGGAYLFAFISKKIGNISALLIALCIWVVICISAYFVVTANQFYFLALAVGIVMGGSQSLSRSTYSKLLPETTDTTSFFSFYDTSEKIAIVLGTASYGLIEEFTGSMRNSVFTLGTFFIVGLFLLTRLKRN